MTKKFLLLCLGLTGGLLFAGCNQPNATPFSDEDTFLIGQTEEDSESPALADQREDFIGPREQGEEDISTEGGETCQEENEKLSEALDMNTDALKACESARKNLAAKQNTTPDGRYQKFIEAYVAQNTLTEFPFPKCGPVSTFSGDAWFSGFRTALEAAAIPLGNSTVQTFNLTGGCASQEGKMAFFLGAQSEGNFEFHLLKYDFTSGKIEEALLTSGACTVCPDQLGKRVGPYLTLFGSGEGTTAEYHYYYADNFLTPKP